MSIGTEKLPSYKGLGLTKSVSFCFFSDAVKVKFCHNALSPAFVRIDFKVV